MTNCRAPAPGCPAIVSLEGSAEGSGVRVKSRFCRYSASEAWGVAALAAPLVGRADRKSTRLNSSHLVISYAVFCLKKKKKNDCLSIVLYKIRCPTPHHPV